VVVPRLPLTWVGGSGLEWRRNPSSAWR